MRERLWHVGSQAVGVILEALDRELTVNERVHDRRTRTIGPLDVARSRCRREDGWTYPLDEALGLAGHRGWTGAVQEAVGLLSCECGFQSVSDLMGRLLGLSISAMTVNELAEHAGSRSEALQETIDTAKRPGDSPDTLIIATDGCQVPQRDGWHEVKVATFYAKESRCRSSKGRWKLLDKEYVATLEDAKSFGQDLWNCATRWQIDDVRRKVVMGDGARWIWNLSALHFPGAIEIVDFYHAVEHLWDVGEALWGDRQTSTATRSWVRRYRRRLRDGRVDLVIGAIERVLAQRTAKLSGERLKSARVNLEYFRRNEDRMRYGRFRQMKLPIGTGVVEGACKYVVQSRFKRPGSRWSRQGLKKMLALKLMRLNNRWESLWPHLNAA